MSIWPAGSNESGEKYVNQFSNLTKIPVERFTGCIPRSGKTNRWNVSLDDTGSIIADCFFTLSAPYKHYGNFLPVSLKAGNGNTFANFGIRSLFFKTSERYSVNPSSYYHHIMARMGVDFSRVCVGLQAYENKTYFPKNLLSNLNGTPQNDFICQAWGKNYFYYRVGKEPFEVDATFLNSLSTTFCVTSIQYPYYVDEKESSKATVIKAQDCKHTYRIIIKNKNGGVHPDTIQVNI